MVSGVKRAPAVGAKGTVINMIINRWLTFPIVDMTWLDSDGKYNILCWVSIFEIIPMFRMNIIKNMTLIILCNKIFVCYFCKYIFNYYWISFNIFRIFTY